MKAYKGFNADMTCRGFQYKEGETYTTYKAKLCNCGFHACEYPLDCLDFYNPNTSVFHEVEVGGAIDRENNGLTKVAATKIKIGARLSIAGLVKAAIDFTMSHIKPEANEDEDFGAASATGDSGAASATGGGGAASATGDRGAASATGDRGAASAENETSVAVAWGVYGRARGVIGAHLVIADWRETEDGFKLFGAQLIRIDGEKFKPNTWYTISNGEIVEVK